MKTKFALSEWFRLAATSVWLAGTAQAGNLDFSDPAKLPPPPALALGYPSRAPNLDALPGFKQPPPGYGEVAFYWWLGDPLTRERLAWQLDQLGQAGAVAGLQVNYAHSDRGGRSYGLTYPSDPPLFSAAWWELFRWFMGEGQKRGMAASLSDCTLCAPGQGQWTDEIIREAPAMCGQVLSSASQEVSGGTTVSWELPEDRLMVAAYHLKNGAIDSPAGAAFRPEISGRRLRWQAPEGTWRLIAVASLKRPLSLDPLHPLSGKKYVEKFFQRFEDRCPGEGGKGLNFFFSDELDLGVSGKLWTDNFAAEFRKRKGYDLVPELPALFADIGPRTPKVRLDYSDVLVSLSEENFFRPIFEWHYRRGMVFGCDHGGRGRNVVEFGDYFRTQRWMTGPGCDQPNLASDIVKNKVASSITHLYQRPRTWLEGYHSSGWGTTSAQITDATFRNFIMGQNLLTLHGLYYSTHGGWWEWAPPCNHFRLPYWAHMREFFACQQRLSYLLSQGVHRCDVAIVYPVAPMEAQMGGNAAVQTAFGAGDFLYQQGIDFDFIDFESLARARVQARELRVSGEAYRVLILPAMQAVRYSTLQKVEEFWLGGGIVIALGDLPQASDRAGRDDPELDGLVKEVFGVNAREAGSREGRAGKAAEPSARANPAVEFPKVQTNAAGGQGVLARTNAQVALFLNQSFRRDFHPLTEANTGPCYVQHRQVGTRDIYMVLGAPKNSECFFRAQGAAELWDPWTGRTQPIYLASTTTEGTKLRLPLAANEAQLIVFSPDKSRLGIDQTDLDEVASIGEKDGKITVVGYSREAGKKIALVRLGDKVVELTGEASNAPSAMALDGWWEFELKPTLDNRFGDFRWPPSPELLGAEARQFRCADETKTNPGWQAAAWDDSKWSVATAGFGPRFWKLGPLPENTDPAKLDAQLAGLRQVDGRQVVTVGGRKYLWEPYDFSLRWGLERDPGHEGYHGLKELVSDEFIALGKLKFSATGSTYEKETNGSRYYLWSAVVAPRQAGSQPIIGGLQPASVWLNHKRLMNLSASVPLNSGANPLLLRYDQPGRGYFMLGATNASISGTASNHANALSQRPMAPTLQSSNTPPLTPAPASLAMRWHQNADIFTLDARPQITAPVGWYRFVSPPGLWRMTIIARGKVQAWAGGTVLAVQLIRSREDGAHEYKATVRQPNAGPTPVALRIEQERGWYGGAALPEPIALDCLPGKAPLGDWSQMGVLATYSGGAWYRKIFSLSADQVRGKLSLDLGTVAASAEVHVGGKLVGVRVAPPRKFDLTGLVKAGENQIDILVYNTLANHYTTIPTRYRGSPVSGLLGPVTLETSLPVVLEQVITQ